MARFDSASSVMTLHLLSDCGVISCIYGEHIVAQDGPGSSKRYCVIVRACELKNSYTLQCNYASQSSSSSV